MADQPFDTQWTGDGDCSSWSDPANWSNGVPMNGALYDEPDVDTAEITNVSKTVVISSSEQAQDITLNSADPAGGPALEISGRLGLSYDQGAGSGRLLVEKGTVALVGGTLFNADVELVGGTMTFANELNLFNPTLSSVAIHGSFTLGAVTLDIAQGTVNSFEGLTSAGDPPTTVYLAAGATVDVQGELDLNGQFLSGGSGHVLLDNGGVLHGGAINANGERGLDVLGSGTLSDVSMDAGLFLTNLGGDPGGVLTVAGHDQFGGATGPVAQDNLDGGVLVVTGALDLQNVAIFGGSIEVEAGGSIYQGANASITGPVSYAVQPTSLYGQDVDLEGTISLAGGAFTVLTGVEADGVTPTGTPGRLAILSNGGFEGMGLVELSDANGGPSSAIVEGSLIANGGLLHVDFDDWSLGGIVQAENGGVLEMGDTASPQAINGGMLIGGRLEADAGSTVELDSDSAISTTIGSLVLKGAGSEILAGPAGDQQTLEQSLTLIGDPSENRQGTLRLIDRDFTATNALTVEGTIELAGGVLTAPSITGGEIVGYGTVNAALSGVALEATSGQTLTVYTPSANGFTVDQGATLDVISTTIGYASIELSSNATLKLDSPQLNGGGVAFEGDEAALVLTSTAGVDFEISDPTAGDVIDLTGVAFAAGAATITQGVDSAEVDIRLANGDIDSFQVVNLETGMQISYAADGAGGSELTFTPAGTGPQTFTMTSGEDTFNGGAGQNTVIASGTAVSAGDVIYAGSGSSNVLELQGGAVYYLAKPTVLSGISTIDVTEGQWRYTSPDGSVSVADTAQSVYLRAGMDATVDVLAGPHNAADPFAQTVAIYGADNAATVNLGAGDDSFTFGGARETVNGGPGHDSIYATAATLGAINGGQTGRDTLYLSGGGVVNMTTIGTDDEFQGSVVLQGPGAGGTQTPWTFTANDYPDLNVIDDSGQADVINLGLLGQTLTTSNGAYTVNMTEADVGDLVTGTGGADTLDITDGTRGNVMALNDLDGSNVKAVLLNAARLDLGQATGISATGSSGADTLTAGGLDQTLTGGLGADTLVGAAAGTTIFKDTAAGLTGDTVENFAKPADKLDITDMAFGPGTSLSFVEASGGASGTLTVSSGGASASVTLFGQFMASEFAAASDGASGTVVTYTPPPAPMLAAAAT